MAKITCTIDPDEVGLDPTRLANIARHFDGYVTRHQLPGYLATVARGGEVAYVATGGWANVEAEVPMVEDTIFRIYSMTKPITQVAAMRLWEEGRFELTDPIAPILGCFADMEIFAGGTPESPSLVRATEPIRVWHLMTHTAGLTYGFQHTHAVDAIYRAAGYDFGWPKGVTIAQACEDWSRLPLLFEPGSSWNYSVATDVLGRLIEVVSGEPLDRAIKRLVLDPLGMEETAFFVSPDRADRQAELYFPDLSRDAAIVPIPDLGRGALSSPTMLSGGGGLCSTAADYKRFTGMLLGGGEREGVRLLSPRTIDYMTRNHLPGDVDLETMAEDSFSETSYAGVGFGLGFSVVNDARPSKVPTSEGSFAWGGAASTAFWVDPLEGLEVSFFTQLLPSGTHPLRSQLAQMVYSSIVD